MEYLSYAASFISTVLGLCEPFGKKMKTILTLNFTGNFLVGLSYCLVHRYSGAAICFAACIQVVINYTFDAKGKKLPLPLVIVYAVVFTIINLLTFKQWFDIFSLIASLLFVISVAQSETKHYRLLYAMNSTVWIFYDFLAKAYGNLTTHIVLFIATFIAIFIRDIKKAANK